MEYKVLFVGLYLLCFNIISTPPSFYHICEKRKVRFLSFFLWKTKIVLKLKLFHFSHLQFFQLLTIEEGGADVRDEAHDEKSPSSNPYYIIFKDPSPSSNCKERHQMGQWGLQMVMWSWWVLKWNCKMVTNYPPKEGASTHHCEEQFRAPFNSWRAPWC